MWIRPRILGRAAAAVILIFVASGCASSQLGNNQRRGGTRYSLLPSAAESTNNSSFVPEDILFNPRSSASLYSRSELHFEHPSVDAFVLVYETRSRGFFERALDRSRRYISRMTAILAEEGVPPELAYLPLIESGYNTAAVSPAGAAGPWQFIPATGRRYGLRIDRYVDERRDPDKSTRAAAQYLKDLYNMFGDWHLSLAAYNTGEYRVARTMDREGTDSYWDLMENRDLHPETCDYVPRFLAALAIAQSPEAHGFEPAEPDSVQPDMVEVDRSVSLRKIAELTGTSETEIKDLNPALLRGVTPPDPSGYPVHVPPGTRDQFQVGYARMLSEARDAQALPMLADADIDDGSYRVRKGDSVASIAKRFGISAQTLLRSNGLKNAKQLKVGKMLRVPATGTAAVRSSRSTRTASAAPAKGRRAQKSAVAKSTKKSAAKTSSSKATKTSSSKATKAAGKTAAKAQPAKQARAKASGKGAKAEPVKVAKASPRRK